MEKYTVPGETFMNGKKILSDSFRYKTENGEISMITPCACSMQLYEIYCIDGDLFEDIERYSTKEEAEKRIFEVLSMNEIEKTFQKMGKAMIKASYSLKNFPNIKKKSTKKVKLRYYNLSKFV